MAHTFDTNLRFSGNSSPLASDYTCGSGATVLVLGIVVGSSTLRSGDAPTYNAVALTQADEVRQSSTFPDTSCELWYLLAPPTGSAYEISVPNPNSLTLHIQVSTYKATAGYISALDVDNGDSGATANPSVSVTTTENGDVIVGVMGDGSKNAPTDQTGINLNRTDNGGYSDSNQYKLQASAGAYATGWTVGLNVWCVCVVAFKEVIGTETVEPTVLAGTLVLLTPSIDIDASPTIVVSTLALTATLNAPTAIGDLTHEPTVLALTLSLKAPSVVIDKTVALSALALSLALKPISITAGTGLTVAPSTLSLSLTLKSSNVFVPATSLVRLIPFIYSSDIAYMIEAGGEYARFYYNSAPLLSGGTHVEIVTPYAQEDLQAIHNKQVADTMWLVHPDYPQYKLTRTSPLVFSLDAIEFEKGPFLVRNDIENDDGVTLSCNVTEKDNTGTLIASSATFESGHVGALFKLIHSKTKLKTEGTKADEETGLIGEAIEILGNYTFSITTKDWEGTVKLQKSSDFWVTSTDVVTYTDRSRTVEYVGAETTEDIQYRIYVSSHDEGTISASLATGSTTVSGKVEDDDTGVIEYPLKIKGDFTFKTHGTWRATVVLERNENNAGWDAFRTYEYRDDGNAQYSGTETEDNVEYRINVTEHDKGTIYASLTSSESTQSGIVQIDSFNSNVSVEVTVISDIASASETIRWAEGAWSDVRGYPSTICFFEGRCVYGGTSYNSTTEWLSKTDDYENFEEGVNDDDSFSVIIPSTNAIRWTEPLDVLLVGTAGDEWKIAPDKLNAPLTPTNSTVKRQTPYGSKNIQPVNLSNVILFTDFVGKKIRELVYSDYPENKYVAVDLTALAEHITARGGIVFTALQKNPDLVLWCGLGDGVLISLTYERKENVIAWAEHPIDGLVQSGAIIPASGEDEVWIAVERVISNTTKLYIEQFQSRYLSEIGDAFFVDCGITYSGSATNVITGLSHLEGKTVAILADGEVMTRQVVSGGEITLDTTVSKAHVGLPFASILEPMRIDVSTGQGTTHGSIVKTAEIVVSFLNTLNVKYGCSDNELFDIDFTDVVLINNSTITGLFTGDVPLHFDGGYSVDSPIVISIDDPLPCVVRSIVARMEKTGR